MKMELFIICILSVLSVSVGWRDYKVRKFSDNFMFGVASSAYQVEGAWDEDGKSQSIWDRYLHDHPEVVADGVNGDVASNSYHQYTRDVEMLRELGVDFYRFSISWTRVLPSGFDNIINEKGLQYYENLIDELLKYNIQPMVTLYHFDLPQNLQDLGGWANPKVINWFLDYAKVVFNKLGSKVKYWITINQPNSICVEGYGDTLMAPAINSKGVADYLCIKNVLLAHAKVYKLYESQYKSKHKGSVGISLAINWIDPLTNSTENNEAAKKAREFTIGLYMNPIWSQRGDFPSIVKETVAKKSKEQGFPWSRLPKLTPEEVKLLKGASDFLGMNHYTTSLVRPSTEQHPSPSFADDLGVEFLSGKEWVQAKSPWLKSAPYGLYKACIYLNLEYSYPRVLITEHGWSTDTGLMDAQRGAVLREYLGALLLALEDGTDVAAYTAWSLMDNVEWTAGVSERFGLYEVDFNSPEKKRIARQSALIYKHVIESRVAEDGWQPNTLNISITKKRTDSKVNIEL